MINPIKNADVLVCNNIEGINLTANLKFMTFILMHCTTVACMAVTAMFIFKVYKWIF